MTNKKIVTVLALSLLLQFLLTGQDVLRYTGNQQTNINSHDGQLPHAMGVHNIQVMKANR